MLLCGVPKPLTISFVGAGALANGLAKLLRAKRCTIAEIVAREGPRSRRRAAALAREVGASPVTLSTARLVCDVLWLAVPDAAIEEVAAELARALERDPQQARFRLAGVEGAPGAVRAAREMAKKLGANSFVIEPGSKTLYHAFGAMLSPMLATELEAAERMGLRAGIEARTVRRIMEPLVLRTVRNVLRNGAGKSFSGPLARGDISTVAAHLEVLRAMPEGAVYSALMEYATETLPVKRREEMKKLLTR